MFEGCEIWLTFGHNKNFRYIAAHTIAAELGDDWCNGLLFMHAFSSCDTISSRKENCLGGLEVLTTLFGYLYQTPETNTDDDMKEIERFVVSLYSRTLQLVTVNAARKHSFLMETES